MSADSALSRLSALVQDVEIRVRSDEFSSKLKELSGNIIAANRLYIDARNTVAIEKPALLKSLSVCDADESKLNEIIKSLASTKSSMSAEDIAISEELIVKSRDEIAENRKKLEISLAEIVSEFDKRRNDLENSLTQYEKYKKQIPTVILESLEQEESEVKKALEAFPLIRLKSLREEINTNSKEKFGKLSKRCQYHLLSVWIGKLRLLQKQINDDDRLDVEINHLNLHEIFSKLKYLSKTYEPGYIEAFQMSFYPDSWDEFIADNQRRFDDHMVLAQETKRK